MYGAGYVAGIVVTRDACQILVSKSERKADSEARLILIVFVEHRT
jgi:hypothetical protein